MMHGQINIRLQNLEFTGACLGCHKLCGRHQLHFPLTVMEHSECDSFESILELFVSCSSLVDCVRRFLVVMFSNIH